MMFVGVVFSTGQTSSVKMPITTTLSPDVLACCVTPLLVRKRDCFDVMLRLLTPQHAKIALDVAVKKNDLCVDQELAAAAQGGHRALVTLLIEKGADDLNGALASAALGGQRSVVELLIEKGADDWNAALASAARGGHRDLVDLFIEKGANDWQKALLDALRNGHRDLVDLFIEKGVGMPIRDVDQDIVDGFIATANGLISILGD